MTDDGIVPGDLIFVTPGDDALTKMISKYDGSRFSHVGIALGGGRIASCRTDFDVVVAGQIGGVRIDGFALFQRDRKRNLYHARVLTDDAARRAGAGVFAAGLAEPGRRELSSFSFAKMFQCAVAVMASRPDSGLTGEAASELVDRAITAGRAWRWEPDRPSFFCAEFVVAAYGWEFLPEALAPVTVASPAPLTRGFSGAHDDGAALEPAKDTRPSRLGDLTALAENVWHYRSSAYENWTLLQLVLAVRQHAPRFWTETVETLWAYPRESHEVAPEIDVLTRGPEVLPAGLVTPRMLCDSGLVSTPHLIPGGPPV